MTVYVDNAMIPAEVHNGQVTHDSRWSHLVADTPRELHQFATEVLSLQRAYFQDHWPYPHYDLTEGKRRQALALGAQAIEYGGNGAGGGRWLPPVLVTSSRDGVTRDDIARALRPVFDPRKVLVAGGARGGDRYAAGLWREWGGEVDEYRVSAEEWKRSRGAGYDRNAAMVEKVSRRGGQCVAVIARCTRPDCGRAEPHGTHGAVHCAALAEAAGLAVTRVKAGTAAQQDGIVPGTRPEPAAPRHGRYYPPDTELPEGICPGCRSAALVSGREKCQACGALEATAAAPQQAAAYPDLSHGNPGHMCVLPEPERDTEAGS